MKMPHRLQHPDVCSIPWHSLRCSFCSGEVLVCSLVVLQFVFLDLLFCLLAVAGEQSIFFGAPPDLVVNCGLLFHGRFTAISN